MNEREIIAAIALTRIPGIGTLTAHTLLNALGSAQLIFENAPYLSDTIPDVAPRLMQALKDHRAEAFAFAEKEYAFTQRSGISCIPYSSEEYPARMQDCADAPVLLYYRGRADLNATRMICMVGTRKATLYGKELCATFVRDLAQLCPGVVVVSGLAYGIDIASHRAALSNGVPTIGVMAHGLDRIYPHLHRQTAVDMLENGGLLTEFPSGTNPDRPNFVRRNRIIAGVCDATIVVESAAKGGSLITAEIAQSYCRDCFAFPGRVTDEASIGCNQLIASSGAQLITSAEDFVKALGWDKQQAVTDAGIQRDLFIGLTSEEREVLEALRRSGDMQINALVVATNIPVHKLTVLLFEMEIKGLVRALQGGVYKLV